MFGLDSDEELVDLSALYHHDPVVPLTLSTSKYVAHTMPEPSIDWSEDQGEGGWPTLPTAPSAGTKARLNAPPKPSQSSSTKKTALPTNMTAADEISADNALQVLRELVAWADSRKSTPSGAPPQWWLEMSPRMYACITALEKDATRNPTPTANAAHRDKGGGSLLDCGSALADAGSPLEGGSACLATIMERLNAQHAAVMEKLNSLSDSPLTARVAPDTTRPPAPPARPGAQTSAPPQAPSLSLAIAIADLDANSPLRKQSAAELKLSIEGHLASSKAQFLSQSPIHSVRRDRARLHVHALNLAQKNALVKFPDEWLTKLDPKASIVVRKIALQADLVNTKFDPLSPNAIKSLAASNPTVITDPDDVRSVRWLHDSKRGKTPPYSSLVITVSSADLARDLIHHGICILGENSTVYVQPPTAQQCYRCQGYGHTSTACRNQPSPRPLACARCASHDHSTSQCECPATTKCTDMRVCSHVKICCVNCGGAHKAFASICSVKANEIAKAYSSSSYLSLVNELSAAPSPKGGARRL